MTDTVGFIGLGNMGGPMALNLVKAGFELVVHDIDPARVAPLVAAGATVEASAEAVAAKCHRTICMVETTDQAESVILGEKGIIQSAKQGDIVLCMSTIDPLAVLPNASAPRVSPCSMRRSAAARMARQPRPCR
jgi:3-hydroxyisobutyrate dehydrogenase-like beta-hydroxyacid dehydrogenase